MQQRLFSSFLALGISFTPSILDPLTVAPALAQTQNPQGEEVKKLLEQARQQTRQQAHRQAIETLQKALAIARQIQGRTVEALALVGIGFNLNAIGQPKEALKYYTQALAIARQIQDRTVEALALVGIGFNLNAIGQPKEALKYYIQALPILREVGNRGGEAAALTGIGGVYSAIGQPKEALKYYTQALPILREVGNRGGEAAALTGIGGVYSTIGQPQEALKYYTQALSIRREVGDRRGEATTLSNIGLVYQDIGRLQEALKYYTQALPIRQEMGDREGEATTLNNIGGVYRDIGQPQEALKYYTQALPIRREVGDRRGEAATFNGIGAVYRDIGQPQEALKYYTQALPIRREVGDRRGEATTLNNIGAVYLDIGQSQEALKYYTQALPIFREVGDRRVEATTLNNIGGVYSTIGQPQEALKYYTQVLPIRREVGDRGGEAATLNNIGFVYSDIGQPQEALKYFNQVLPILQEVGDPAKEATTLSNIGFVYQDTNRLTEAIANWERSIQLTLQIRSGLLWEQRQDFVRAKRGSDVALVNLLVERKQAERAYQWLNLTATAELADYTRLLNARVVNSEAQAAINTWNQKKQQLQFLRQRLGETYSVALALQVRTLEAEVNQEAETLARRFPEIAELFETTPADIAQLQASIPVGTTVLHPVLLTNIRNVPNALAFFILTRDQLQVVKTPVDLKTLEALLTKTAEQLNNRFDDQYLSNLANLYDQLIRPIESKIQATQPKQLSIIATGKLRYLPFEAFYDQKTDQYLIQKYPVSYLTRLSSRSLASKNMGHGTAEKRVLAIGNPVPKAPLALPAAETEVQEIVKTIPGSEAMIREQATLAAFKLQALRFPFLHLATHGCFQKGGCPKLGLQENTILFADQKFNIADAALLGLQNVELITLSACQTALRTESNGEEIAGLAYLFERAGAKATIASLWNADDKETQGIMVQFYQNLKQGMSKGEALQKAKLSQIDSHPFFWAPFVLIGDAR